jgi:hypothetical protein
MEDSVSKNLMKFKFILFPSVFVINAFADLCLKNMLQNLIKFRLKKMFWISYGFPIFSQEFKVGYQYGL